MEAVSASKSRGFGAEELLGFSSDTMSGGSSSTMILVSGTSRGAGDGVSSGCSATRHSIDSAALRICRPFIPSKSARAVGSAA